MAIGGLGGFGLASLAATGYLDSSVATGVGTLAAVLLIVFWRERAACRRLADEAERRHEQQAALLEARTAALRECEAKLGVLVAHVPALISYIDAGYRYRLVNRSYQRWFGLPPDQVVGKPVREVLGEAAWEKVRPWMARALAGEAVSYEQELPYRESGPRWVSASYTPDIDETGAVRGFVVLVNDVSARVVAETALRERERMLRAIIDNSPSALSLKHPDGRYALANPNLQRIHERPEDAIVGKTDFDLYPEEAARAYRANDARVLETRARQSVEEIVPVDGQPRVFMSHIFPVLESDGSVEYICRISLDVTDRKRAEAGLAAQRQRLSGIVGSAMDAIISVDGRQRIVLFNAAAEAMFRCPVDAVLGTPIERFIPARFRSAHAGYLARFGETGATSRAMGKLGDVYGLRADGTEFPLEASISQIEVEGEKLYTVILRDITVRVAIEEEIRRMNAELEARVAARTAELQEANRELETFAYAISHDLRAPLRAINGYAGILAGEYGERLDETGLQYLRKLVSGTQRMGELIDGILQLSRSARGELVRRRVDLSALAHRILSEYAAGDRERSVRWEIESGLAAEGDPRMLEALMRNLLDNAWKYTARKTDGQIRLHADRGADPPRYCVTDNGAGFNMAYADKLFEPFQRLHRQGEFAGIGIGLATVQRIVRRHGGEISAQAVPGEGASFCFTLAARSATTEES